MNEEQQNIQEFTPDMVDYLRSLIGKGLTVMEKSKPSSNVFISLCGMSLPVRVDDLQLLYIGSYLLPNIMNYLVNILPQFLYPYVVAYLQDLSAMRDDPVTINELYDFLIDYNHGTVHDNSETED